MDDHAIPASPERNEAQKYASDDIIAAGLVNPLFFCPSCRDRHFVRVDVDIHSPYFANSIPCPHCNVEQYDRFIAKHGVPPTMPRYGWTPSEYGPLRPIIIAEVDRERAAERYAPSRFTKDTPPASWGERDLPPVPETPAERRKRMIDEQKERNEHG
jgi:hypothetical protein